MKLLSAFGFTLIALAQAGDRNTIYGSYNSNYGDDNYIEGNSNVKIGSGSVIRGSNNRIVGNGHRISGSNIHMFGPKADKRYLRGYNPKRH